MRTALALVESPFFIIGSPRSGTTLLRLLLTCHSQLVVPPECGFVAWLHPTFGSWGASDFADPESVSRFVSEVSASRKFETWSLATQDMNRAILHSNPTSFGEACSCIYRLFCKHNDKETATWGDKNNHYLNHIEILHSIFPRARFIHIVRDGRDVACSYREVMSARSSSPYRPSLPTAIGAIARQWALDVRTVSQAFDSLDQSLSLVLRYEDLTANPEAELTRVCDWLEVPYCPEMLQFHVANRKVSLEPQETMGWKSRTLEPVNRNTVGRYASLLPPPEIAEFNRIAATELQSHSYLSPHQDTA